jgi:DNA cross-link repair 1A protein
MGTMNRTLSTPKKSASKTQTPLAKKNVRPNGNILNFFKKVEVEESLFLSGNHAIDRDVNLYDAEDSFLEGVEKFNEVESSVKKRKLSEDRTLELLENKSDSSSGKRSPVAESPLLSKPAATTSTRQWKGPFVDDSDSDDNVPEPMPDISWKVNVSSPVSPAAASKLDNSKVDGLVGKEFENSKDEVSKENDYENIDDFADLADFNEDEELEGEEFRMMRFMQEQARIEAEEAGNYSCDDTLGEAMIDESMTENCPICNSSLARTSPDEATRHVNSCLDGNPTPLPRSLKEQTVDSTVPKTELAEIGGRFAKAAVARPGQANPFTLKEASNSAAPKSSAFAKLMSGHAEDAAWATAAAAENASRGKSAYQRTCPFYKIMPGFYICVDAFRYGAVEGCKAYFLSHFHSDHYIGLTAGWCHGPIYCSRVTGSLVKKQLRVAEKWVVEIDFEKDIAIPGTEGVSVTMIPANHCPGSSLFLFQKTLGKRPDAKTQRILHCGDFRACTAHVTHPLLKPEVIDSLNGKSRQQKIDICYLDTTYLNPRYSFPPQEEVIRACAELCSTMSPDPNCVNDIWEKIGPEAAGGVSKFFTKPEGKDGPKEATQPTKGVINGKPVKNRILVVCGTYSIGKERICKAIAQALGTKIFASAAKIRICSMLGDPELTALMTTNPLEAQVHMQMLMEIRAETLQDYLTSFKPHFSRIVGLRPSGWNYRPSGAGKLLSANTQPIAVPTSQILHSKVWRSRFSAKDLSPQRGSTKEAMCFGVPYSEHSSFRELAMFIMSLRIERIVPTVNVGSDVSRRRMKGWIDKWMTDRRKGGLAKPLEGEEGKEDVKLWEGKDGSAGGVWW